MMIVEEIRLVVPRGDPMAAAVHQKRVLRACGAARRVKTKSSEFGEVVGVGVCKVVAYSCKIRQWCIARRCVGRGGGVGMEHDGVSGESGGVGRGRSSLSGMRLEPIWAQKPLASIMDYAGSVLRSPGERVGLYIRHSPAELDFCHTPPRDCRQPLILVAPLFQSTSPQVIGHIWVAS